MQNSLPLERKIMGVIIKDKMKNGPIFKTIILSVNLLGVCAIGAWQWHHQSILKKEKAETNQIVSELSNKWDKQTGRIFEEKIDLDLNTNAIPLEVVIANLSQNNNNRYLTIYPVIKFIKGDLRKSDFEKVLPGIREKFLDVINQKNPNDILEKDGISKLKEELLRELNDLDLPLKIEKIYFSSVVVS